MIDSFVAGIVYEDEVGLVRLAKGVLERPKKSSGDYFSGALFIENGPQTGNELCYVVSKVTGDQVEIEITGLGPYFCMQRIGMQPIFRKKDKKAGRKPNPGKKLAAAACFDLAQFNHGVKANRSITARQTIVAEVLKIGNPYDIDGQTRQVRRVVAEGQKEAGTGVKLIFGGNGENEGRLEIVVDSAKEMYSAMLEQKPFCFDGWCYQYGDREARRGPFVIREWGMTMTNELRLALEDMIAQADGLETPRLPDKNQSG